MQGNALISRTAQPPCIGLLNLIQDSRQKRDRVIDLWRKALQGCTKEKWQGFIKHSEQEVKNDWRKYIGVDDVDNVPPFIINTSRF